ncbi:hypothetical protein F0562_031896 [Nyssa sinensis]|uniref:Uncharacterized protein n=1 Tax=Nyssa sinensis TaxID=561372 RepID=A0A5J5ATT1_9ASTE|nr:hypothetical protein F0562_031896 [Nyssa sinensis]
MTLAKGLARLGLTRAYSTPSHRVDCTFPFAVLGQGVVVGRLAITHLSIPHYLLLFNIIDSPPPPLSLSLSLSHSQNTKNSGYLTSRAPRKFGGSG